MYLYNLIPAKTPGNYYSLRKVKEILIIKVKHGFFEKFFPPPTITELNDLDYFLRNALSIKVLKQNILKFIPLNPNKVFKIHNQHDLKILTRLRNGLSHLEGHKLNHSTRDCLMKFLCEKKISNLRSISSFNVPYFLKEGKSS